MRVLVMVTPGIGHAFPVVPLSWALQLTGHEVLVATCGPALAVGDAGLQTVDVAPGLSLQKILGELGARYPELVHQLMNETADNYRDSLVVAVAKAMSMQTPMIESFVRTAEEWRPDLVVYSPVLTPGLVAAAKLDVPAVEHGFGLLRTSSYAKTLRERNADIFERHGVDLPTIRESVDIAPPSMVPDEPSSWPMRFVPYGGGGTLRRTVLDVVLGAPEADRIAVTLGTGPPPGGVETLERILQLASEVDIEFVLVLPNVDVDSYGALPKNVRSVGWVPLATLLKGCSAVVHHGGAGTTLTALASGIPQLILGYGGFDRHLNAEAVTRRGAGLTAPPETLDQGVVELLVGDERLRTNAREVREEICALPRPAEVAARLVDLAGG